MAKSKTKPDVLGLGIEIVKQLGEVAEDDLLAAWMAEYLGEKISKAKQLRGMQRKVLEDECADLILKLWSHRHQLPNGARPLESFEPIFLTLKELSQEGPRYSLLRNQPPVDRKSEVAKIMEGILAIDQSASTLIRYFFIEAVEKIPKSDKRWMNIRSSIKSPAWDIDIVRLLIDDAEGMTDNLDKLKIEERKILKDMLDKLNDFDNATASLRIFLEEKIAAAK